MARRTDIRALGAIALERQVSQRTIANQLRSMYEKLGVKTRSQLVSALARR